MSTPFMGEIKIISWNYAPKGWALCNGQFLPINQNQALFSLLGTSFGGNGQTTFALPDFRGRIPIHKGGEGGWILGQVAGQEFHTLTLSEMPTHLHFAEGQPAAAAVADPSNAFLADISTKSYGAPQNLLALAPTSVGNFGGSQPHENRQPFLVLAFIIALQGIFPSQN